MEDLRLKIEQVELKDKLLKLIDYINSDEFYKLSAGEKKLISQQRAGMEMYLDAVTKRIYGDESTGIDSNSIWLTLIMGMLAIPSTPPPFPDETKEKIDSIKKK